MYELVEELGLETVPTWNHGEHVVRLGGRTTRLASHRGAVPRLSPFVLADLFRGLRRFEQACAAVPTLTPWTAPDAELLDGQTFETWIRANLRTETARTYFRVATEAVFSAQSTELSALHAMFYCHSGTDLETLLSVEDGAQQDRIVGGAARISEELARRLGPSVRLGQHVVGVDQDHAGCTVRVRDGGSVSGSHVIVTLPPTLAGRLVYEPVLPSWRDQLTQRVPAGSVIKFHAVYERPFWRDEGLTGQLASEVGPVKVAFDNSPPDASVGVLMGFFEGAEGRHWARRSASERASAATACLEAAFGPRAADPIEFLERDWMAEPYSRGCYGAHFTPGVWSAFGPALREPVGRIHWAGAECAAVWNGYMEGAVRSGELAADEVLAARG
jgi:monoamine oxidase